MTDTLRRLGASDLKIAQLVLGGNVFGWTADRDASFAVLDAFVDGGGTMIDTADVYSAWVPGHRGGESESMIGAWLKASGKRDRVLIATKVGMLPGEGGEKLAPARIAAACEASLQRLGTDRIDLYFAHQDDEATPQEAVLEAFGKLVDAGKVRVLGASNFHATRLKSAVEAARAAGLPHYQVLQPEYNLVSRAKFEGELQDYCVDNNVGVVPYYGLAAGFLTGKYRSRDDLGKSVRGRPHGRPARRQGQGGACGHGRGGGRDRRQPCPDRARLADGPTGRHRADRQRDQRRPAARPVAGNGIGTFRRSARGAGGRRRLTRDAPGRHARR